MPEEFLNIDKIDTAYASAMLNILEDFQSEKELLEASQKALLNILEDSEDTKQIMERGQRAMLNLLQDQLDEKVKLENTEKAVVNILEDYGDEKEKIEEINKELEITKNGLEFNVQQRTFELKKSNDELESFSYSVSHDLRAPLRAINGYCEILKEDYSHILDKEGIKSLDVVIRNASKMARLIDDILSFSRLGRQRINQEKIDLVEIFSSVYTELTERQDIENINFTLKKLPPIAGDRRMLTQLVTNLLSNALKYTEPKSKRKITVSCKMQNKKRVYSIEDNGVGFDMKYADKLFGVFQRLHKEKDFEGTGVGLAIARRIILHHNGNIWAEAKPDEGATFYFTFDENADILL